MTKERRGDIEKRQMFERAAEAGATKALTAFVTNISPHDIDTHDGLVAFRSDLYHANKVRKICETVKSHAMKTAIGAVTVGVVAAMWQTFKTNFKP